MRMIRAVAAAVPLFVFGCKPSSSPTARGAPPGQATTPTAPAAPQVPMFHAIYMNMDMSRPLVDTSLAPGGLAGLSLQAPEGTQVSSERGQTMLLSAGV